MKVSELHIDGFGIFNDTHISGFDNGINVIYGENEYGKTTLLEFVRRLLFGFPSKKNKVNQYPAVNGGSYGGSLTGLLDNGESIIISRSGLAKGGIVKIETSGNVFQGQHELDLILKTSGNFFQNVYAITIEEIQALSSLQGEDIKNRIYGAGLELGNVSLGDLRKGLSDHADQIFKGVQGQIQLMPKAYKQLQEIRSQIRDCRQDLPLYLDKSGRLEELEADSTSLSEKVNALNKKLKDYERRKELFNDFVEVDSFQSKLDIIPDVIELPSDIFTGLEKLKAALNGVEGEIKENSIDNAGVSESIKRIKLNSELVERRGDIIALQKKSGIYTSAQEDIRGLEKRITEFGQRISDGLGRLGIDWDNEKINSFNVTVFQRKRAVELRDKLKSYGEEIRQVEYKRKLDVEQRLREISSTETKGKKRGLIFPVVMGVAGVAALITGVFQSYILSGFGAFMVIAGIIDFIIQFRSKEPEQSVKTEISSIYEDELNDLLKKHADAENEWEHLVKSLSIPVQTGPDVFENFVGAVDKIQSDCRLLADIRLELGHKQGIIGEIKAEHNKIIPFLEVVPSNEIVTNIELLMCELEQAEGNKGKLDSLLEQFEELNIRKVELERQRNEIQKKISDFFASFGVENEHQLKQLQEKSQERQDIENKLEVLSGRMKKVVGAGEYFEEFIGQLKEVDPVKLEGNIEELKSQLVEEDERLKLTREQVGKLKSELDSLASHDDLNRLRNEEEVLVGQLNDMAREWAADTIALRMLEKAVEKYEKERQPGVITKASSVFAEITGGKYPSIFRPVDADDLFARDEHGRSVNVMELSRGTREELYLAMRLGLIAEYETRSESMPLIMDDVMVNFDDNRGKMAINALKSFAHGRQVIVMTCKEDTLQRYLSVGARQISF